MYPHTKFGISTSKNIGDMDRTRKRDGRTDGRTDWRTDSAITICLPKFLWGHKKMQAKLLSIQRAMLTNSSRWLAVCETTYSSPFHNQLYIWTIVCCQSMWHWVYHVYHFFCCSYHLGNLKVNCMLGSFSCFCSRLLTFFQKNELSHLVTAWSNYIPAF